MSRLFTLLALLLVVPLSSSCVKEGKAHADCSSPDETCRPTVTGMLLDGSAVDDNQLKGKIVLVNFWATWCQPCRRELPALSAVYNRHLADGFTILGLVSGDRASDTQVQDFVNQSQVIYPIMRATTDLEVRFGMGSALPTSFLYDRKGRLVAHWSGGIDEQALEEQIKSLL